MSAYAYMNGMVRCEHVIDGIPADYIGDAFAEVYWHKNEDGNFLFSFSIKESRLEYFKVLLDDWALLKTQDSVAEDWYHLEFYILVKYESDHRRIDCIEIFDGKINQRQTFS